MVFGIPLKHSNANHRAHHADGADLEPCLASEAVENEDRDPGKDEQDDADAASGQVSGMRAFDAASFEQ